MLGKEAGCDTFYECIHELWGHLLPKVKIRSLSTISLLDEDPNVKSERGQLKLEGGRVKCERSTASASKNPRVEPKDEVEEVVVIDPKKEVKTEQPRRRIKVVKIEIDDSDDEAAELQEYQAIVRETGGPTTLEEIELRMNYLRRLPA